MAAPTLVWSARPNNRNFTVWTLDESVDNFMNAVFSKKAPRTDRLHFRGRKVFYTPSNEYREFLVRIRNIK